MASAATGALARFLASLGFLSRLAPARLLPEAHMGRAMFHLPLCGLVLGAAVAAPAALGLFAGKPLVQAWLAVVLLAWLTRGLHLDGLSDVLDGAGAHLQPERFWEIIKDSRAGVFGVVGVVLALLGQALFFAEMLRAGAWWAVVWAVVFGRSCGVVFGSAARGLARPGLGGLFLRGATASAAFWAVLVAAAVGLAPLALPVAWPAALALPGPPPLAVAAAAVFAVALLTPLFWLCRAVSGVNGDFLGAAIILGEIAAGLGFALAAA